MVALCLADQCVKLASRGVGLELAVPYGRVVLDEPLPKAGQVFLWEALHGPSDVGHGGHGNKATPVNDPTQLDLAQSAQRPAIQLQNGGTLLLTFADTVVAVLSAGIACWAARLAMSAPSNYPVFKGPATLYVLKMMPDGNAFVLTSSNERGGVPAAKKRFPVPNRTG